MFLAKGHFLLSSPTKHIAYCKSLRLYEGPFLLSSLSMKPTPPPHTATVIHGSPGHVIDRSHVIDSYQNFPFIRLKIACILILTWLGIKLCQIYLFDSQNCMLNTQNMK